ncbi:MAG: HAD-IC family P-type ATPase [Cyclobacteriaceae bacterium]|nr:HAD-IC family P-type ATPase [Cyclobacteriaceae bacterium]
MKNLEENVDEKIAIENELACYHCGQPCADTDTVWQDDKPFCCTGCETVYSILSENNLCDYYTMDTTPGVPMGDPTESSYYFLDEPSVRKKIIEFDSTSFARILFNIPAIHCISCIWLLENLHKINTGVLRTEVNFSAKTARVDFNPSLITPGQLAQLLSSLGYAPLINSTDKTSSEARTDKSLLIKLAIAGFAFGNVMLLSFPEYLGLGNEEQSFGSVFGYLNIALSIPVVFFSARDYFVNAWKSFSQRQLNIDVPIALGLAALFLRSLFEIITHSGAGYLDSLTGLVFFLLIGRWFQSKTYETLAFDRDYTSYFPLAVLRKTGDEWKAVVIQEITPQDRIRIRNLEVVPSDSELVSEKAFIDYSFVTGETRPVKAMLGDLIYAGGRILGQPVELIVTKPVSQGHLTSLWNNPVFQKPEERGYRKTIDRAARYFTFIVLGLAIVTAIFWYFYEPSRMWLVLTSVLMVACPCALALAAPFTFGSYLRVFGRHHLYLKNSDVVERLAGIDTIVFDKTGTVTYTKQPDIHFIGNLSSTELDWIKTITSFSTHPLSNLISRSIRSNRFIEVTQFKEYPGRGIEAQVTGITIKIGSASFVDTKTKFSESTVVFINIDGNLRGYFSIGVSVRPGMEELIDRLGAKCHALLSGDNEADRQKMRSLFGRHTELLFQQSPMDKLAYIRSLQQQGKKVMMIGDGLNDAGALKQSDVGIAISDDTSVFTPSSDGILQGDKIGALDTFLDFARTSRNVLRSGFALSFFYNAITLSFAITGNLTPLVAAILMPISSISVVVYSTMAVRYIASRKLNRQT